MYKEKLKFNKDRKFTILQVSDAQDMHIPRKAMFKMLDKTYDKVKPDLIVLTGDNILGNHIDDALIGKKKGATTKPAVLKRMRKALGLLLDPIERRKIPFAFIYGNHDDMNIISKKEQAEIYGEYNFCVPYNTDDNSVECDTYNIPVYSSNGDEMKYNIWMLDSAGSDENGRPMVPEVCIFFNGKLIRGNRAIKINAEGFHAFESFNYPHLCDVGINFQYHDHHILDRKSVV